MTPDSTQTAKKLTVMIFKDNFAARTFQVPLKWISSFGLGVLALILIALSSLGLATHFYFLERGEPNFLAEVFEQKLAKQKLRYEARIASLEKASQVSPEKTSPSKTPEAIPRSSRALLFNALPTEVTSALDRRKKIEFSRLKIIKGKKSLKVRFNIEYTAEDSGYQQGRIIILARGSSVLSAYPKETMNFEEGTSLIHPKRGEYFSVSRLRPVSAEFAYANGQNDFKKIEILIFSKKNELLIRKELKVISAGKNQNEPGKDPGGTNR